MLTLRKYKRLSVLFSVLSALFFLAPFVGFAIIGFQAYQNAFEFRFLIGCVIAAGFLFIVDLVRRSHFRTVAWILLIGIVSVCQIEILRLMIYIAGGCVLIDDFVFSPLAKHYKFKYKTRKEIELAKEE